MIVKIARSKTEKIKDDFLNSSSLSRAAHMEKGRDLESLSQDLNVRYKSASLRKESSFFGGAAKEGLETAADAAGKALDIKGKTDMVTKSGDVGKKKMEDLGKSIKDSQVGDQSDTPDLSDLG